MLVVLVSVKGAPGVTTSALALAGTWPTDRPPLVLEVDPSGGDLTAGFALASEPGLVSLAATARREAHRAEVAWEHTQVLPGGLPVVAAPVRAEQASAAVEVLTASMLLEQLSLRHEDDARSERGAGQNTEPSVRWDRPSGPGGRVTSTASGGESVQGAGQRPERPVVIADAGRLPARIEVGSPATRLLQAADVVLLVTRDDARSLVHAAARIESLTAAPSGSGNGARRTGDGPQVRLLLVRAGHRAGRVDGGYDRSEVAAELGLQVAGVLPIDVRAAALLAGRPVRRRRGLGRAPLFRAAASVASALHAEATAREAPSDVNEPHRTETSPPVAGGEPGHSQNGHGAASETGEACVAGQPSPDAARAGQSLPNAASSPQQRRRSSRRQEPR